MGFCFVLQWFWILPSREQLGVWGAGGDEGTSSGVLFERNHWTAADQWVSAQIFCVISAFSYNLGVKNVKLSQRYNWNYKQNRKIYCYISKNKQAENRHQRCENKKHPSPGACYRLFIQLQLLLNFILDSCPKPLFTGDVAKQKQNKREAHYIVRLKRLIITTKQVWEVHC